ncbi:DUF4038 domain-containing protein [Streptococcus merionis]|uniref:apiosidase-like domain-containing protein n=1 Tax=Streptococcus merionis TaxID=400065 RepID=UPI0026EBBA99|nr:DUF4038 domain-containing protein [Streptococcus merionis]
MLQISDTKRTFTRNGFPFFYLADTCWSAFTNISEDDWIYYLDYRKAQGFNVIQVNMLWQWDASGSLVDSLPFEKRLDGTFDYDKPNESYFDRAYRMIAEADKRGFTIALVLFWVNYLPDTWASKFINQTGIFPKDKVEGYVSDIVHRYDEFNPIYVISGDTDFPSEEVIDYYELALNKVKSLVPHALTTLHIRGRESSLPVRLRENPNLDFYMYQSGHNSFYPEMPYYLAEEFYRMEPIRPLLNSEPCYEMMGYSGSSYGRWSREDVRRAAWQSVLSGAHAGLTYGAAGIYSWHIDQTGFNRNLGEGFDYPYDWRDALKFRGAWDYGFVREIFERYEMYDLFPSQNKLIHKSNDIRVAENSRFIFVYVPHNTRISLRGNLSQCSACYIDLDQHFQMLISCHYQQKHDQTVYEMHKFVRDALLIIDKNIKTK